MVNSLTVFLAFVGFLVFGYLSLVRLLARRYLTEQRQPADSAWRSLFGADLARNIGSSAFFVSLPATAMLLFWGWGAALIWLIVFHFLVDSVFQLLFSAHHQATLDSGRNPAPARPGVADHMLRAEHGVKALLEQGLIQVFFLLSMAVVVALVATLIDRQPGLLFALVFLIPARKLISHSSGNIPTLIKFVGALLLLGIGLIFSDQLGFSVYGDWAPLPELLPWLVFNMPTLIAAIIVVAVFQLEKNQGFKRDLAFFAGVIIAAVVFAMVVKLLLLRPVLDAPMNTSSDTLPSLLSMSLFIFAGFTAVLIRLLNEEENSHSHARMMFRRLQTGSALHNIYMSLLVLSLAAAMGIGAWKTHYFAWSIDANILDYLQLAISSNLNLIHTNADDGTLLHTILLAALCFTGFSFLLMCANQLSLEEAEKETLWSIVVEAKLPQALGIFTLSAYFIGAGISVNVWLIIGILAWALFIQLAIGMCIYAKPSKLFSSVCLILLILGAVQILLLLLMWFKNGAIAAAVATILIMGCAALIWMSDISKLVNTLTRKEKVEIF